MQQKRIPSLLCPVAIADVYDVRTSGRPYKQALPHHMAIDELRFMGGRQLDPTLVERFVEVIDEYVAAYGERGDATYRAAVENCPILKRRDNVSRLVATAG